jgi:hypothetical protein
MNMTTFACSFERTIAILTKTEREPEGEGEVSERNL